MHQWLQFSCCKQYKLTDVSHVVPEEVIRELAYGDPHQATNNSSGPRHDGPHGGPRSPASRDRTSGNPPVVNIPIARSTSSE